MHEHSKFDSRGHAGRADIESDPGFYPEAAEEGRDVSVRDLLQVVWRWLWVIALVAFLLTASVVGFSLLQTPEYEASIKILVAQEQEGDEQSNLGQDVLGLQQLTQTVVEVVLTRPVAEEVIRLLDLETTPEGLLGNVSAEQVAETQVVEVSYRDTDPETAQQVANAIGEVSSERVAEVSPSASTITATVLEGAVAPGSPVSPDPVRNGLLALVLGVVLGLVLAFLLEQLDDRWRSPEEVERASGVPTFGVVHTFEASKTGTEVEEGEG